ncbi:Calcium-binding EF-hand [Sulfurimonas denitrificans DSM 1251]|uniref:Calcium-binding EF-hand n=1 Tax=Sulfurimonas denitrificans (strain ATCC 33889 / DSM 1251) TaxID=326298 RepID=Q30S25_SULDN|nr:porin family protein [Sulfurimonas denitrificans]ABB44206.1 Calcium-binding EF-hand [Sulfurimonas denitrificans DSM 1251]
MKFSYVTAILLLSINLFADESSYKDAIQSYNAKEFAKAYPVFEELSLKSPANAELNFFLGRSALELKRYDEALTAFDRVLMLNPSHTRTHMELARLYYETGQLELSQGELDLVLKENLPQNIRDVALAFKTRISEQMKRHTFGGAFIVGMGYDSNANNDIGRKEFIIPLFNMPIEGNEKVSDTNLFATFVLNHSYDFGDRKGWMLESSFVAYTKLYKEYGENDLSLFSLSVAPTWSENSYKLSFPLTYDRIFLDNDGYLYNLSSGIRATYMLSSISFLEGGYTYKRGYYDEDKTQDSNSHTISASYKRAIGEDPILFSLNTSYVQTSEVNSGRTDVESSGWRVGGEIAKMFKNGVRTSIGYTRNETDYEKFDPLFQAKRSDERHEYEFGLGYSLSNSIMLNATLSYVENNSNQDPFNYDKITAITNAIISF